jgi:hypothetical protein
VAGNDFHLLMAWPTASFSAACNHPLLCEKLYDSTLPTRLRDAHYERETLLSGDLNDVVRYDISCWLITRGSRLHAPADELDFPSAAKNFVHSSARVYALRRDR